MLIWKKKREKKEKKTFHSMRKYNGKLSGSARTQKEGIFMAAPPRHSTR